MADNGVIESKEESKNARLRSPAYPVVSLSEAISEARKLYEREKRNWVSPQVAFKALGYKDSMGGRVVAALLMYGLAEEKGSKADRLVKISDRGYLLVLADPSTMDWQAAIREAALSATIFRDMLDQWPDDLPSDSTISHWLTFKRNFNPNAVQEVIENFRATYDFAKLSENATITPQEGDTHDKGDKGRQAVDPPPGADGSNLARHPGTRIYGDPGPRMYTEATRVIAKGAVGGADRFVPRGSMRIIPIPLGLDVDASLEIPIDLSEENFDFMIETLLRYKSRITVNKKVIAPQSVSEGEPDERS